MSIATLTPTKRSPPASLSLLEPFGALSPFGRTFGKLFDDFWGPTPWAPSAAGLISPSLDITEDKDFLTVSAELPGIQKENVKVTFENGVLSISGEKLQESEKKDKTSHRLERHYGAFSRTLTLPTNVNFEASEAQMRDGVLEIRIPKREEAKTKSLTIK